MATAETYAPCIEHSKLMWKISFCFIETFPSLVIPRNAMLQHLKIQFQLYYLLSDLGELKDKRKIFKPLSPKIGCGHLWEVFVYKRFQMSWSVLETFGILENRSQRRGSRLWKWPLKKCCRNWRFDCIYSHPPRDFSIVHNSKLHSLYMKPSWLIAASAQNCPVPASQRKWLVISLLPLNGMLVHHRFPQHSVKFHPQFSRSQFCCWVKRGTVRFRYLFPEHNTVTTAELNARAIDAEPVQTLIIKPAGLPIYMYAWWSRSLLMLGH